MIIDYNKIADAIQFYQQRGYKYIDVPWVASLGAILETKPAEAEVFKFKFGNLVGSGEQSLIDIRESLERDHRYVCATPCFRDEKHDEYHLPYFFKVELMHARPRHVFDEHNLTMDAIMFFRQYSGNVSVVPTDIGKDIYINGLEVGSYGYRQIGDEFDWVYGTGCAEPRLSQALQKV